MTRRANGEGTIGKRADGSFYGSVRLEGKYRWVYGKTKKEVSDKLKALRQKYDQGANLDAEKVTVAAFLDRWLEEVVKQKNKFRTYAGYKQIVRDHLKPSIGKLSLASVRPDHIQALLNQLTAAGKSPRTVRNVRAALRKALNQALRWRYITYNPAALVETPRVERYEIQPFSKEEARRLMDALKGHRLEALYLMALMLGLREGELLGLLVSSVNLEAGTVKVDGALQWQEGKLVRETTKTRASIRTLPLPASLIPLLRAHIERQQEEFPQNKYLFASSVGTPINPRNLARQYKALLKKAFPLPENEAEVTDRQRQLHKMRFHDTRHTCATLLIARGEHPRTVMDILGHSQISTTMNTYGHILDTTRAAAIAGLDAHLSEE
jgi:integrase